MLDSNVSIQIPKGMKYYTFSFRHPLVEDKTGKYGLKVYRSLGTSDLTEANNLVEQLYQLMKNEYWHNSLKRDEAYDKFSTVIVDAFYDPIDNNEEKYKKTLDNIFLPGKSEDYSRGLLVGVSGAGKTSLLRLLAGTEKEKFPTTSTGRTTTCNLELIFSEEKDYEIVVNFMSRHQFEMFVQENIEAAIKFCLDNINIIDKIEDIELCDKLLVHKDLGLRLNYLLGDISLKKDNKNEFDEDFNDEFDEDDGEVSKINNAEINTDDLISKIRVFLNSIKEIANSIDQNKDYNEEDYLFEENEDVLQLRNSIVEETLLRFQSLNYGVKINSKGEWINSWYYKTTCRDNFIQIVKRFSSNAKKLWGSLLTPLVNTMRVKGRFKPDFINNIPKIVLFDGQGLGHKTTASSIPSETIRYFPLVDSIILVDNAEQPIMENVKIALKGIIEYGKSKQLICAFTHVDGMHGDNLNNFDDRKRHVTTALNSYLYELRQKISDICSDSEINHIKNECYFFSKLNKCNNSNISKSFAINLINKMKENRKQTIEIKDIKLFYNSRTLCDLLREYIFKYRDLWGKIIGFPQKDDLTPHWTKIRALTKRLAYSIADHYNYELMPLADFRQELSSAINIFINKPADYKPKDIKEDMKKALMNIIKMEINDKLADFVRDIMWQSKDQFKRWEEAYYFYGKNSTVYRSMKINEIFDNSAPKINNSLSDLSNYQKNCIIKILDIVDNVINSNNSVLRGKTDLFE